MGARARTAVWLFAAGFMIAACGEDEPPPAGEGTTGGGASGAGGAGGQGGGATVGSGGAGGGGGGGGEGGSAGGSGAYAWKNVTILGGGFVSGLIFSPAEPGLLYARTDVGGAYRWDAGAKAWEPLTDWIGRADANLSGIESLAPDPSDASKVYLAAGTYTQSWAGNGAFLRSSDRGESWERTDVPFKMGGNEDGRSMGERLAVDPNDGHVLYFGSRNDGLWRSTDAAVTWSKVESFPVSGNAGIGLSFVLFDATSGAPGSATPTIYVGVADATTSLYRSTDGGATWQPVAGQPAGLVPTHAALDAAGTLYLSFCDGPGPNGVTDGALWKISAAGQWEDITPVAPGEGGWDTFGYGGLAVDAENPGTVMVTTIDRWAAGDQIYRSTDGGAAWAPLGPSAQRNAAGADWLYWHTSNLSATGWMGDIEVDPFDPDHALHVTGQGVWRSDDVTAADAGGATHWAFSARGLEETVVLDLISPPSGAHLLSGVGDIAGFRHDDLKASPAGGMFSNPVFGNTTSLDFAESDPAIVVRVGTNWSGARGAWSEDGGETWAPFAAEPAGSAGSGSIAVSADGSRFFWAASGATPCVSTDRGATWTPSAGLPGGLGIVSDRVSADRFYAFDAASGEVFVSSDGGVTFAATATDLPELPSWQLNLGTLQAVPGIEGDVWLTAAEGGLFHSTDAGASFTPVASVEQAFAIGFGMPAPGQIYPAAYLLGAVGGVVGVFRSDDAGATWTRINDDQHQFGWINQIAGDPRVYGRVYLGTSGRGIVYGEPD